MGMASRATSVGSLGQLLASACSDGIGPGLEVAGLVFGGGPIHLRRIVPRRSKPASSGDRLRNTPHSTDTNADDTLDRRATGDRPGLLGLRLPYVREIRERTLHRLGALAEHDLTDRLGSHVDTFQCRQKGPVRRAQVSARLFFFAGRKGMWCEWGRGAQSHKTHQETSTVDLKFRHDHHFPAS